MRDVLLKATNTMTRAYQTPSHIRSASPFSHGLRELPAPLDSATIDINDIDFVVFNYKQAWLITIEEKCYGAEPSRARRDSQSIIAQMLEASSGARYDTMRGRRAIEYRGHYEIVFERTSPRDSQWISINGVRFSGTTGGKTLLRLLECGEV